MLHEYNLPVYWEMYGRLKIKANSLEEAIEKAYAPETGLPHGEYVGESFHVDKELVAEEYPDETFPDDLL